MENVYREAHVIMLTVPITLILLLIKILSFLFYVRNSFQGHTKTQNPIPFSACKLNSDNNIVHSIITTNMKMHNICAYAVFHFSEKKSYKHHRLKIIRKESLQKSNAFFPNHTIIDRE